MLENWISPPIIDTELLEKDTLGNSMIYGAEALKGYKNDKVCILCDNSGFANEVRKYLFSLKNHLKSIHLIDIGQLKKGGAEFFISPIRELLLYSRIIFISERDIFLNSIFQALATQNNSVRLSYLARDVRFLENPDVQRALKSESLLNLALLGYQRHYCSQSTLGFLHKSFINHYSLGQLTTRIEQAEPIIRACQGIVINMAASNDVIDSNGQYSPNGITALQACQISKYCGLNEDLKILNITKGDIQTKDDRISSIVAQMIWYYLEGTQLSEKENLKSKGNFQEHSVQTDIDELYLTFWKSKSTGKWWFEIPSKETKEPKIYPCSFEDYQAACKNEITEYVLNQIKIDH